jgi:3-oxoacyl-[acyl-carrier protein] reductase
MKLDGRVALVTGASRGIGRAIAIELAAKGAAVAVNFRRSSAEADEVVAQIVADGGRAIAIGGDVADFAEVEAVVARTVDSLGGLHVLVNNAGIAKDGLIYNMDPGDWLEVMRVNFGGVVHATKAAMSHLMVQREGAIVNVSSVMGDRAWMGDSMYAASKAAVSAFTRSSALELARFGVRVNAVLPGFVETELIASLLSDDHGMGVLKQIPMRAFARPEDVARTVVFLAGPDAGYITGSLVTVDGGASSLLGIGAPLR